MSRCRDSNPGEIATFPKESGHGCDDGSDVRDPAVGNRYRDVSSVGRPSDDTLSRHPPLPCKRVVWHCLGDRASNVALSPAIGSPAGEGDLSSPSTRTPSPKAIVSCELCFAITLSKPASLGLVRAAGSVATAAKATISKTGDPALKYDLVAPWTKWPSPVS
jgi:hypothetical protein